MTDGSLILGTTAVVGMTPSMTIVGLRRRDAIRWGAELETHRLRLSSEIDPAATIAFLNGLSGLCSSRLMRSVTVRAIAFEIIGTERGIGHYMSFDAPSREIVTSGLRANLPGVTFDSQEAVPLPIPTLAGELVMVNPDHHLEVDHPEATSRALLAALQPLEVGESMRIQLLLFPFGHRRAPDPESRFNQAGFRGTGSRTPAQPSKAMRDKFAHPLFGVVIRLGVTSDNGARDRQLLRRLTGAFHPANSEHAHLRRRRSSSRLTARALTGYAVPLLGYPCRLNSRELGGLFALAGPGMGLPGLQQVSARQLAPSSLIAQRGLVVADSTSWGMVRPLAIPVKSALMHCHLQGGTGSGKSTLLLNVFAQVVAQGYGAVFIDPKVDAAEGASDLTPADRDLVYLDPTDAWPIGIDLFAGGIDDPELVSERIVSTLHQIFSAFWGPRTDHYLRHATLTLVCIPGATFTELPRLLSDASYRRQVVAQLDDPIALGPFWAAFEAQSEAERSAAIGPVLNKLAAVVARPRLRRVLGQTGATIDFDDILASGKVLIIPLSAGTLGEDAAALLGSFVMSQLWAAIQRRVRLSPAERKPVFVFVDEFQQVARLSSPLPDVLAQARAMGVGFFLANQNSAQLDVATREAVMANCRSKIYFQTSAGDARRLAPEFSPYLAAQDIQSLRPYEVAMILAADGGVAPPVTGLSRPAPEPLGHGGELRERSRQRYGRDADEIDAELRRRYVTPSGTGPIGRQRRSQ